MRRSCCCGPAPGEASREDTWDYSIAGGELWLGRMDAAKKEFAQLRGYTAIVSVVSPARWSDHANGVLAWLMKKSEAGEEGPRVTRAGERAGRRQWRRAARVSAAVPAAA